MRKYIMLIATLLMSQIFGLVAHANSQTEDLAAVLAVHMNQALRVHGSLVSIYKVPGLSEDRSGEMLQFLNQHQISATDLEGISFHSRGSLLLLSHKNKITSFDLTGIHENKVLVNGRTIKVTRKFSEVYESLQKTFPNSTANFWMNTFLPEAKADFVKNMKAAWASVVVSSADFSDMSTQGLMNSLLFPDDDDRAVESFSCNENGKISWVTVPNPKKKSDAKRRAVSYKVVGEGSRRVLTVEGMSCDKIPFIRKEGEWFANGKFNDSNHEIVCTTETNRYRQFEKCCDKRFKPNCESELQARIALEKKPAVPNSTTAKPAK